MTSALRREANPRHGVRICVRYAQRWQTCMHVIDEFAPAITKFCAPCIAKFPLQCEQRGPVVSIGIPGGAYTRVTIITDGHGHWIPRLF